MKNTIWVLLRSTALVLAAAGLIACSETVEEKKPVTPRVKVLEVSEQLGGQIRQISGKLVAADQTALSFGVGGTVVEVNVSPGEAVEQGQVLSRLDSQPFELALKQARAQLNIARAEFNEKSSRFGRMKELVAKNVVSRADFEVAEAELSVARGNLSVAESTLDDSQRDLDRVSLEAPFKGQVVERSVDAFQEVSARDTVFTLQSNGALEVEVLVPETLIREVDYGQIVRLSFPTFEDLTLNGHVTEIGSQVIAGNAFPVRIQMNKAGNDLRPGMSVSASFNFDAQGDQPVFLIPLSALALDAALVAKYQNEKNTDSERRSVPVFLLNEEDSTLALRSVKVGDLRGNKLSVFEGLKAGDLIVTAGVSFLKEGMQAERWDAQSGFVE